jgi:hypothetical protein
LLFSLLNHSIIICFNKIFRVHPEQSIRVSDDVHVAALFVVLTGQRAFASRGTQAKTISPKVTGLGIVMEVRLGLLSKAGVSIEISELPVVMEVRPIHWTKALFPDLSIK